MTGGYRSNSHRQGGPWGLEKDARLRFWPKGYPYIKPGTFAYPVKQRWFASDTQMSNEPVFVDGGEKPSSRAIYYHSGLDIGGVEERIEVVAATDGLVVSLGDEVLSGQDEGTPVQPRYDVIYIRDRRGWYYRYSHLYSFDEEVELGKRVRLGQRLGLLGKEGGSGGWSHLHFEIKSKAAFGQVGHAGGICISLECLPLGAQAVGDRCSPASSLCCGRRECHFGRQQVLDQERKDRELFVAVYRWVRCCRTQGRTHLSGTGRLQRGSQSY